MKDKKYIIVTGGVLSGLGKGVTGASIGLFFSGDYKVVPIKLDGYLNVDPGTMNPIEHGEVFILDDGGEVDMDFGHYERFLNVSSSRFQSLSMGKIYSYVRKRERRGDYLGKTVQLIPHVSNLIQNKIVELGARNDGDIVLVEVGGTVGDMENEIFIEALRQFKNLVGEDNIYYVHLSYIPIPAGVNEQKTKPTQQSVNLLQSKGIFPDAIVCRCEEKVSKSTKEKIALFANLKSEDIFSAPDLDSIYKIPQILDEQNLIERVCEKFNLDIPSKNKLKVWNNLLDKKKDKTVKICIAGKYTDLEDAYASVVESLNHCSYNFGVNVKVIWLDTSIDIDYKLLQSIDGVIVPGGFGSRGTSGKINVIKYVRENKIPFLGICYGLQLAVIEFAKNVCSISNATSLEIDENAKSPVITILDEQKEIKNKGGTMRLGSYDAVLKNGIIKKLYEKLELFEINNDNKDFIVKERHRHRYEVNPEYHDILEKNGLIICGKNPTRNLVEFIELKEEVHPYFVATQAHPELKSKLEKPAPLFYGLVEAAIKKNS